MDEDMWKNIQPIEHSINATISIIGSKSISHRALLLGAMASGSTEIFHLSPCHDVQITISALQSLGIAIIQTPTSVIIHGTRGSFPLSPNKLHFGDSGTSYRFFMALATRLTSPIRLEGSTRMAHRPIHELTRILREGGANIHYLHTTNHSPIQVEGPFVGGKFAISLEESSQFASALMLIAPLTQEGLELWPSNPTHAQRSIPYLKITTEVIQAFGAVVTWKTHEDPWSVQIRGQQSYQPQKYHVEGDYSNAAYFFVACAIHGGTLQIDGLQTPSMQGDAEIIPLLTEMGCHFSHTATTVKMTRDITQPLHGITRDMGNFPDLVPPLAIAALFADSSTHFTNIAHLEQKESPRISILHEALTDMGAQVTKTEGSLSISPSPSYSGIRFDPQNDHRLAMSLAVAGTRIPGIYLYNPSCVDKSYPTFYMDLLRLYAR